MPMSASPHPYQVVARFLDGFLRTEALAAAFELGIIQALEPDRAATTAALAGRLSLDPFHLQILLDILTHDGVLRKGPDGVSLAEGFRAALAYRDLLEVRMEFGRRHRRTVMDNYAASIRDPYRNQGRLHQFKFHPMADYTPTVRAETEVWVRFISTFTRYAAPTMIARHDFSRYRHVLDIGGNNGELAVQLCRAHPDLRVTVFDIPVVCDIGTERVAKDGLAERITFIKGDAKSDPLPRGADAAVFSTVLTDHTPENVDLFLGKAHEALAPGTDLVIWEPAEIDLVRDGYREWEIDLFPFISTWGPPTRYEDAVRRAGFRDIRSEKVDEIRFLYTTARR
jgi:ubiquinone/menaquinone biosynthesis C-methylase UbiE